MPFGRECVKKKSKQMIQIPPLYDDLTSSPLGPIGRVAHPEGLSFPRWCESDLLSGLHLDRIKIEAEQRMIQARAEAESQRLQRETLTPIMLQLRAIEKWDGKLPQVSGGATPLIDLHSLIGLFN